ncbi:MAG: citramalate synthase [Deltaproteobacteria bacterium]
MAKKIDIYDTTLRDGTQGEGVNLSVNDKLAIAERLDDLGIAFVEGGWPGSNPRDEAFFKEAAKLRLKTARIAAFGSTARPGRTPAKDDNVRALVATGAPVATIVGKAWDMQVRTTLRIPLKENLKLIRTTLAYLKSKVETVIFDAEHFFDGYQANPDYAMACLEEAARAGTDVLCLCDTRGGSLPEAIAAGVKAATELGVAVGIHCHNDSELAVANSLSAVEAGATQVQGTINGFGERCGNTNLCSLIPTLQLKAGYRCIGARRLAHLSELSRYVYEAANVEPHHNQAYVGRSAFAHKGGLHVSAVRKNAATYEHIDPKVVGNEQRVLVSDLAGRSSIEYKAKQFGFNVEGRGDEMKEVLSTIKERENFGFQFEGAEASLELLMRENFGNKMKFFRLVGFRVIDEKRSEDEHTISEATVTIEGPDGSLEHTAATGNGPVNALDLALRKALEKFYPQLASVQLHDYKVRVLEGPQGTGSMVRVFIESGDEEKRWGTVGVSHNLVEASWQALVDSIVYKLHKDHARVPARRRR